MREEKGRENRGRGRREKRKVWDENREGEKRGGGRAREWG